MIQLLLRLTLLDMLQVMVNFASAQWSDGQFVGAPLSDQGWHPRDDPVTESKKRRFSLTAFFHKKGLTENTHGKDGVVPLCSGPP